MKRYFVAFVLVLMSVVMYAQSFPSWLAGKWEIPSLSTVSGSSYEEWTSVSGNHFEGKTYRIFGNDTIIFDHMSIRAEGKDVVLKMSAEKGGKRFLADFKGKKVCEELWAFECAESDSPSAIYYRNLGKGQVYVWTEVTSDIDVCTDFVMYRRK
ncbi:MAG: hypothetical protein J5542_07975 [Bacteroidales bacterium]|nr:hypothetical protein [Bacteroidales bacterium]